MSRVINYIVIHCTAGAQKQATADIKKMWKAMGWKSPGYHYLISMDGSVEQLADEAKICNGVAGHNANAIHVSYKGGWDLKKGVSLDNRTQQQKDSMLNLLIELKARYPKAKILGHRDLSKDLDGDGVVEKHEWIKVCPSFDAVNEFMNL